MANPRCRGPTRSIFMLTVVAQHRPWFTPSSTFATTIQLHAGAEIKRNGTGRPAIQPATSRPLRLTRSASPPAARLAAALTRPNATRNERVIDFEARPNSASASSGTTVRSMPTIAPTKALMRTRSENCRQLAARPSRMSADGAAISAGLEGGHVPFGERAGFVVFYDAVVIGRRGRDPGQERRDEIFDVGLEQRRILSHRRERRGDRTAVERRGAVRVPGQDQCLGGEHQEPAQR